MGISKRKPPVAVSVKTRQGFTLVELLVVIAVIGILLALLLPAVQSARESGRKTACMSNAYQLGMAVNRFDQDKGRVPRWQDSFSGNYASWPVALLPYIERNDLYGAWVGSVVRVNIFLCPSSPPDNPNAVAYAGNAGDGSYTLANGVMPPLNLPQNSPPLNGTYSLEDVADGDGTATTLLFAERSGSSAQPLWNYSGAGPSDVLNNAYPCFGHGISRSSSHVDGGVVAFCDGHTYFLGSDVAPSVLTQLITSRNSGASTSFQSSVLDDSQY